MIRPSCCCTFLAQPFGPGCILVAYIGCPYLFLFIGCLVQCSRLFWVRLKKSSVLKCWLTEGLSKTMVLQGDHCILSRFQGSVQSLLVSLLLHLLPITEIDSDLTFQDWAPPELADCYVVFVSSDRFFDILVAPAEVLSAFSLKQKYVTKISCLSTFLAPQHLENIETILGQL